MLRRFVLLGLTGCVTYQPGVFAHGMTVFTGEKATLGCLDIAIERRDDHDKSAVLAYRFGNRCDYPTTVNLAAAHVIGRDAAGGEHVLRAFDPKLQIRPLPLDARLSGGEAIAYISDAVGVELVQVCVDAGSIVAGQPSQWMCFAKQVELPPEEPVEDVALVHEEAA